MAGCPLENPRNWLPAVSKHRILSDEKFLSPRGNLILSRFAGQPMKNLAELARAVRPLKPWKKHAPSREIDIEAVELSEKPSGFLFFFWGGKKPILGNLKESHIVVVCLLVDFWGGFFSNWHELWFGVAGCLQTGLIDVLNN